MSYDVDTFAHRYRAARQSRTGAALAPLWWPDGRLHHPTLNRPLPGYLVPAYTDYTLTRLPDLDWTSGRWAGTRNTVFLEWTCAATIGDKLVTWSGVDLFILRDGRIDEEMVYHDTMPLWAARDPAMRRDAMIDPDQIHT